ncbi:hypothetical protein QTP88_022816 [Uroleucon formosanum]
MSANSCLISSAKLDGLRAILVNGKKDVKLPTSLLQFPSKRPCPSISQSNIIGGRIKSYYQLYIIRCQLSSSVLEQSGSTEKAEDEFLVSQDADISLIGETDQDETEKSNVVQIETVQFASPKKK